MLLTNDVGILFATMQAAYGNQWPHKADAMPVWQEKLRRFTPEQVMKAANDAIDFYPDFPPSIGQLIIAINTQKPPVRTYLPAPKMALAMGMANRLLLQLLHNFHGVDRFTLDNMVKLKTALVEELDRKPDEEFLIDLENQLTALAEKHDEEEKQRECEMAQQTFRRRMGSSTV